MNENTKSIAIYLAGGFHSAWQETVKSEAPGAHYIDPREHNLTEPEQYTLWDLQGVDSCEILFAYIESSNPAGYALALEIGYAKARGKKIILVDEKSYSDKKFRRYWAMCRECADVSFSNIDDAIAFLNTIVLI